ncbi:MAG: hypothetical protein ACXADY_23450 [Candidatus Hodarchaeales archaeon]
MPQNRKGQKNNANNNNRPNKPKESNIDYYRFSIAISREEEALWKEHQHEYNKRTLTGFVKHAVNQLIKKQDIKDALNFSQSSDIDQFQKIIDQTLSTFNNKIEKIENQQTAIIHTINNINNSINEQYKQLTILIHRTLKSKTNNTDSEQKFVLSTIIFSTIKKHNTWLDLEELSELIEDETGLYIESNELLSELINLEREYKIESKDDGMYWKRTND